jgi:hypothetical protein
MAEGPRSKPAQPLRLLVQVLVHRVDLRPKGGPGGRGQGRGDSAPTSVLSTLRVLIVLRAHVADSQPLAARVQLEIPREWSVYTDRDRAQIVGGGTGGQGGGGGGGGRAPAAPPPSGPARRPPRTR